MAVNTRSAGKQIPPARSQQQPPAKSQPQGKVTPPKNEALVKKQQAAPARAVDVPEYLQDQVGNRLGTESVDRNDMVIPRLALAQSLTPQLKKTNPAYIEGLEIGNLFNTATGEIFGDSVDVVPLFFFKNRIKFNPIESGGGIDCQSQNGLTGGKYSPDSCDSCKYSQFEDGAPECDKFLNFMSVIFRGSDSVPTAEDLIVVSMKSTGIKVAKKWNAIIRMTNLPMFAKVYTISHTLEKKGAQEWEQYVVTPADFVSREFFEAAKQYFESMKDRGVEFDTTGMGGERSNSGDEDWDSANQGGM